VDKIHILRRVKQGRELKRPEVHISRNYREDCACDHKVMIPTGEFVMTPCNKYTKAGDIHTVRKRIYVIGAHGVGKTTLIHDYSTKYQVPYYENESKNPHADDIVKRQLWRLYKYKTDEEILDTIDDDCILVSRCCLDWLIYTTAFKELGWITEDDYNFLISRYELLFGENIPDTIVYLNPPRDWSKERIIRRWGEGKKWREDDFEYYEVVRRVYDDVISRLLGTTNIVEINDVEKLSRIEKLSSILQCG